MASRCLCELLGLFIYSLGTGIHRFIRLAGPDGSHFANRWLIEVDPHATIYRPARSGMRASRSAPIRGQAVGGCSADAKASAARARLVRPSRRPN